MLLNNRCARFLYRADQYHVILDTYSLTRVEAARAMVRAVVGKSTEQYSMTHTHRIKKLTSNLGTLRTIAEKMAVKTHLEDFKTRSEACIWP